jgi:PDZ domain
MLPTATVTSERRCPARVVALVCASVWCAAQLSAQSRPSSSSSQRDSALDRVVCDAFSDAAGQAQPGKPVLGVKVASLTPSLAARYGLPDAAGAVVQEVVGCSPADLAGVSQGDVIRRIDGHPVADAGTLVSMMRSAAPAATVRLSIIRGGNPIEIPVQLGARASGADEQHADHSSNSGVPPGRGIVPGVRVGSATLGTTLPEADRVLGQPGPCRHPAFDGNDTGTSECDFERWGVEVDFSGDPGSGDEVRRATTVIVSPEKGAAAGTYLTDRGIRLGSTEQDVLAAYGQPSRQSQYEDGTLSRSYDGLGISFDLAAAGDHAVQAIRVYPPSR